jgi:alcohol dehydrogenase
MRQLTFLAPGRLEWREVPDAHMQGDGEALVRPLALGRCDLDAGYIRGLVPLNAGSALGHEMVGEVVLAGDRVSVTAAGRHVLVPAQISCGVCDPCRRGHTGRCASVPFGASYGMGREGGFGAAGADLVRVPFADAMLVPLPSGMDPVLAAGAADMALDAYRAVAPRLAERPGAAVLVLGGLASVIGLYAAGLAVALGAGHVAYRDDDPERRAQAERYGAEADGYETGFGGPYAVIVDACGRADILARAFRAAEPEGAITSVCIYFGETPVPLGEAYWKGVTYRTGRPNLRPQAEPVLALCQSGRFNPAIIDSSRYPFDQAPEAFVEGKGRVIVSR